MTDTLTKGYEMKKNALIGKLLDLGVFKTKNRQLYELSLSELEDTYRRFLRGSCLK